MRHYLLIYHLTDDYLERRPEFRGAHLALAKEAVERGELFIGGATADPADMAVLVFSADSTAAVERFVREDPYVTNGLVDSWEIRPWTTVVGKHAAQPA